jgi:transcriptional regulator of heat shock response
MPERQQVRFGMAAVKGVGVAAVEEIIRAREADGRFQSVEDFATIGRELYMNGIGTLFSQPEFIEGRHVQAIARLLDNIEPWLREAAPNQPLNVFIGSENPIGKSSGATLIISKFRSPYSDKSYIGVIGPTRQNYTRTMQLVRKTGSLLEEVL